MERYPFDVLPSGSVISELIDFTDDYNDPFLDETWRLTHREMTRFFGGPPIPFRFSQEPLGVAGVEEIVGEGFGNLPQEEPLSSNDYIDEQRPECDISPQVEPMQSYDVPQEEQPQDAAPSQERIYPVHSYSPQQSVWVRPQSALLLPSYLSTTTTETNLSVTNEPMSNSNDMPVEVASNTSQRTFGLFARIIDVIDISPNNQQQQSQLPIPPPPLISLQTPPPQRKEERERAPKKIPVPVLHIKPLTKTSKSQAGGIRKEFHCDFPGCNKILTSSSHLNEHKKTHSSLKPYKCDEPLCGRKFARLSELNRHKKCKHSSEKLYRCGYCKNRMPRQDQFVKHENACSVRKFQSKNK